MRKRVLTVVSVFSGFLLAACGTMRMKADSMPEETLSGTYLAGNFAAAEGDVAAATNFYAATLKDDPSNQDVLARTFLYAAESGDTPRAITLADKVIAREPQNLFAHVVLEAGALKKNDYAAVLKDLELPGQGAFVVLTNNIIAAWAHAGQGDVDAALTSLDGLSQQRGADGLRLMHKALILDYAGRAMDAEAAYREALATMGSGPRVLDAFGRFLRRHNRVDEAKALYMRALADNPGNPAASDGLADIAANKMPGALVSSPADGVAEALFGIAALLGGDERNGDVAILYLNLALYLRPDFDLGRVLLASRYEGLEKFDIANSVYAAISPKSPYYAVTQVEMATNEGRLGETDAGVARMKTLSVAHPNDADIWTALGDLLRSADRYQEAAAAYNKALAEVPVGDRRLVGLYFARGVSFELSNRWDDAEKDFRQALKLNPDRADVLNNLGYSLVERGEHLDEAVAMLEKARALRPLDGYIADSVGWAYYKLGRFADAARTLEEAVQLAPGAPDVNEHLGDAYWQVGRRTEARFQWQHALSLGPEAKEKPIIERKLQFGLDSVAVSGS